MATIHIHIGDSKKRRAPQDLEDSRFAESALVDLDEVLGRIAAAATPAKLRQVCSELETARKEDVIEIARRYTGTKKVSTRQAINAIWNKWYNR